MAVQYNNRLQGRTVVVLPASCLHSVVVTMRTADKTKSKSSTWRGGGGGAAVTND